MIGAAIFDMDGLLINSEPLWCVAHSTAVRKYGAVITDEDVHAVAGRKVLENAQGWIDRFNLNVDAQTLCDEITAIVADLTRKQGRALPGVHEALELFAHHDIPMAVASSATPEVIDAVMERLQLEDYFLFTYSATNEPKGKPDPGIFLSTARKLGILPADCLVFEDAISGIRAAKAAGMQCIAVPEAHNHNKSEFKEEADVVLGSLLDLRWDIVTSLFAQ